MKIYDYLFQQGTVVDGSLSKPFVADVAIKDDRIVAIGQLMAEDSIHIINIKGKIISPGFIDVHTHDDTNIIKYPQCIAKISQGVTTVIVGNCGISASPLCLTKQHINNDMPPDPINLLGCCHDLIYATFSDYVNAVEKAGPAVNVAALIGHSSLRTNHMNQFNRVATQDEIEKMKQDLSLAMDQGAIGLSTGLAYSIARESTTDEVIQLAKIVGEKKGIYTTHLRNEFAQIMEALEEAFTIGNICTTPVIISHHKCAGPDNWGRTKETLPYIAKMAQTQKIMMDCYPYNAGSSTLDLGQIDERIKLLITWSESFPEQGGRYLKEIAKDWGISELEAGAKLQPAGAIYFSIDEEDMRRVLLDPKTMIGSDGLPNDPHPHPRLWGTFPRIIGIYSRDLNLFSLQEAIHKMTGLSATNFNLKQRGFIKTNYYADLVIFDYDTIADSATFENPIQRAKGIEFVFVNGKISYQYNPQIELNLTTPPNFKGYGRFLKRK